MPPAPAHQHPAHPQQQSVWDAPALLAALEAHSIKTSPHAVSVWRHTLQHTQLAWADVLAGVPNLPKAAAQLLGRDFAPTTSTVRDVQRSARGDTTKLLIELRDGLQVEAVIMAFDTSARYADATDPQMAGWGNARSTLCVSSQVGCQMGCTFCATGTMGLTRSLTCGEIVEQLVHARRVAGIRNIVFMGMGEPLSCYDAVKAAVGLMADSRLFGIGARRITLSTVGVIPRIRSLAADMPGVRLALSLHAPNQELRKRIVPSARAYPLPKLLDAVAEYQAAAAGARVFVEYVLLAGVNDGDEHAHELGRLLAGRDVTFNAIPWNPVHQSPGGPVFEAPGAARVAAFQAILRGEYGMHCTVRQEKGADIAGACGQLVIDHAAASKVGSGCGGGGAATTKVEASAGDGGAGVRDIEELL